jgi:WD40 repeat protein
VVNAQTGAVVRRLDGHASAVRTPTFSADGRLMAAASASRVIVWELRSGRPAGEPLLRYSNNQGIADAALSPDGRTLAVASGLGAEILDVATRRLRVTLEAQALSVRFTPDGRVLAVGHSEGRTQLVSTETWRPVARPLAGHTAEVLALATSPDGSMLATGSSDGTIRLFDIATGLPVGAPLRAVPNRVVEPMFTPDGAFLFGTTGNGRAYRWDVRPSSWARHACAVAGRTLTRTEWNDVLPGRDYAPAC